MSSTGWCLSPKQYISWSTIYMAATIASEYEANASETTRRVRRQKVARQHIAFRRPALGWGSTLVGGGGVLCRKWTHKGSLF